jgi:hypothetical protein
MKLTNRLLIATLLLIQSFYLSAQENPLPAYFPADAKAVININLLSLGSRMSWQEIQQLSFFDEAIKDAPLQVQEFMKDPASCGINFKSDLFIVLLPDTKNKTKSTPVLYGQIADSAKFVAFMQKMSPKQKITSVGKLKLLVDDKQTVAWTSNVFVMPFSKDKKSPVATKTNKTAATRPTTNVASLSKQYQQLLTPATKSLSTDSRFIDLTKESGDIRFWVNRNTEKPKGKGSKKDEMLKMMNWSMMQQGNYMAGVVRFENGKLVAQMKSYMNNTLDSLYRLYPATSLNSNVFRKFPPGQPVALISFSMSPAMIGAMLKTTGADKMLDSITKKSSVKPLEVAGGINGDITLAVIRAHEYDEKDTITAALNGVQLFLAASVKDKSKVQPLLDVLQKPKEPKKDEEGNEIKPSGPFGGLKPTFLLSDSFLVMSISPLAAEKFLAANSENDMATLASSYTSHSSIFALDLKTIINFAMAMGKNKNKSGDASKMFESLERLVIYGGKYENGAAISTAELQFANKEENSLKQLIKLIETAASMDKKKSKPDEAIEDEPGNN